MNDLPSDAPRLDPIPFIIVDGVLIGAAALFGWQAEAPLGIGTLACITALVGLGAITALYPFVINHARRQEEAVQERANQIEALARTVGASAEQISIAVANLPAIAENASRQLKASEQLPSALKEQLATLQHQLSATASEENAALRHELDTLRGAETARLAAALDGLTRATADLARLETLAAKHSAALDAAIAHLPRVAEVFTHQAGEALRRETVTAVNALHGAAAEAGAALAAATNEARAAFDRGVRDAVTHLATQAVSNPPFPAHAIYRPVIATEDLAPPPAPPEPKLFIIEPETKVAPTPEPGIASKMAPAPEPISEPTPEPTPEPPPVPASEVAPEPAPAAEPAPEIIDDAALDEPLPTSTEPEAESEPEEEPEAESESDEEEESDLEPEAATEPEPTPDETPEPSPAAAATPSPSAEPDPTPEQTPEPQPEPATEASETSEPDLEPIAPAAAPADDSDSQPAPAAEPALSHDGYTRLIATAYIGIGNKLFVRGDGPGLRRDKGVPLQFVSIGKWRWESAELLFPAKVKLYKNDQIECVALGELTLEPGHHHEVNATF